MTGTRDKIIDVSVAQFNERGFVNITMRDIAAASGISPGNLAYHFRNKDAILKEIYERMVSELAVRVSMIRLIPSFENIDYEITPFLEFQRKYRFFYLDTVEICRAFPEIAAEHQRQVAQQADAIRAVIEYSVGSGNMMPEPVSGTYDRLAHVVWMIYSFWLSQALIRSNNANAVLSGSAAKSSRKLASKSKSPYPTKTLSPHAGDEEARRSIWTLVLPYLTPKGKNNFESVATGHGLLEKHRK